MIDKVVVGDAPEGFAISPTGKLAVALLLRGSNNAKTEFFYNRNGSVAVLKIDGKKVTKVGEVEVADCPKAPSSALMAAGSMSAISSTPTSPCCGSMATP